MRAAECVKQRSVSTGTGDVVFSGAIAGYRTFSETYQSSDTFVYEIHAVDAVGVRAGQWEVGIGQFIGTTADGQLRRLSVLASSALGGYVDFGAGEKDVSVSVSASQVNSMRFSHLDVYVQQDGDDANGGFGSSPGAALWTIDAAIPLCALAVSTRIHLGPGQFSSAIFDGQFFSGASVEIVGAGIGQTFVDTVCASSSMSVSVSGLSLRSVVCNAAGSKISVSGVDFIDAGTEAHVSASAGGEITLLNYSVSGSAAAHVDAGAFGSVSFCGVCDVAMPVTFSKGFVSSRALGFVQLAGGSFVNPSFASGNRFSCSGNSVFMTNAPIESRPVIPGAVDGLFINGARLL